MKLVILAMATLSGSLSNSYGPTYLPAAVLVVPHVPRATASRAIRDS